jgi:DNA-binding MarR family transcriptional regulator
VPNPADGRSVLLALTARGRKVLDEALGGFARAIGDFRSHLEVDEADLLRHLEAMSAALAAATRAETQQQRGRAG